MTDPYTIGPPADEPLQPALRPMTAPRQWWLLLAVLPLIAGILGLRAHLAATPETVLPHVSAPAPAISAPEPELPMVPEPKPTSVPEPRLAIETVIIIRPDGTAVQYSYWKPTPDATFAAEPKE